MGYDINSIYGQVNQMTIESLLPLDHRLPTQCGQFMTILCIEFHCIIEVGYGGHVAK